MVEKAKPTSWVETGKAKNKMKEDRLRRKFIEEGMRKHALCSLSPPRMSNLAGQ